MITREQKEQMIENMKDKLERAQSVILCDYSGITVKDFTGLRAQSRKADVELVVVKNTLGKIAADQLGIVGAGQYLNGPTIWVFSMSDPAAGPKLMKEFARTRPRFVLKGGILDKKGFNAGMAEALADLPSKEVLLGQVAGMLQSPIASLVRVLQGPISKFGYALEDYRKMQEKSA